MTTPESPRPYSLDRRSMLARRARTDRQMFRPGSFETTWGRTVQNGTDREASAPVESPLDHEDAKSSNSPVGLESSGY